VDELSPHDVPPLVPPMKPLTHEHEPNDGHLHDWERYFSGWVCLKCGTKYGNDYQHSPITGKPRQNQHIDTETE
jgi:hypothetical protein